MTGAQKNRLLGVGLLVVSLLLTSMTSAQAANLNPKNVKLDLNISPQAVSMNAGSAVQAVVSVNVTRPSARFVMLSAIDLPAGLSATFQPQSGYSNFTSSLTLAASQTAPAGNYLVTIVGTAGPITKPAQVNVNVQPVSPPDPPISVVSKGVNYLSLYHMYSSKVTTDAVLRRDFSRFQQDGIGVISLSLYWYRLEGNVRGDYDGTYPDGSYYGRRLLDNVKRVAGTASQYNIKVLVSFHTLWGGDSPWCTPDYVVDPVSGKNIGLAIVRSGSTKQAFIDMFNHTVTYLAGSPGIWAWAINEPWYWGRNSIEHDFVTENGKTQKENFITLFQNLSKIVKTYDGRPLTVRFVNAHWTSDGTPYIKNIFVDDWRWDQRIFDALDFISLNAYMPKSTSLYDKWYNITKDNVYGSVERGKKVWITEFGSDDDTAQTTNYKQSVDFYETLPVEGWLAWYWRSDGDDSNGWMATGKGFNLCSSTQGVPRPAYFQML